MYQSVGMEEKLKPFCAADLQKTEDDGNDWRLDRLTERGHACIYHVNSFNSSTEFGQNHKCQTLSDTKSAVRGSPNKVTAIHPEVKGEYFSLFQWWSD